MNLDYYWFPQALPAFYVSYLTGMLALQKQILDNWLSLWNTALFDNPAFSPTLVNSLHADPLTGSPVIPPMFSASWLELFPHLRANGGGTIH